MGRAAGGNCRWDEHQCVVECGLHASRGGRGLLWIPRSGTPTPHGGSVGSRRFRPQRVTFSHGPCRRTSFAGSDFAGGHDEDDFGIVPARPRGPPPSQARGEEQVGDPLSAGAGEEAAWNEEHAEAVGCKQVDVPCPTPLLEFEPRARDGIQGRDGLRFIFDLPRPSTPTSSCSASKWMTR